MTNYRSIFISDTHLGFKASKAKELLDFLKNNQSDYLYLVGDIVDIQRMMRKSDWKTDHTQVIDEILLKSNNKTEVYYITGNHDSLFRKWITLNLHLGNIKFFNQYIHTGIDRKKYLVLHGDLLEKYVTKDYNPLVKFILHTGYNILLNINNIVYKICNALKIPTFNYVEYIKRFVKQASDCVDKYENVVSQYAYKNNYDGVICGHIHTPNIRDINGVTYLNCGDWVSNCSGIVEHYNGKWELVRWK